MSNTIEVGALAGAIGGGLAAALICLLVGSAVAALLNPPVVRRPAAAMLASRRGGARAGVERIAGQRGRPQRRLRRGGAHLAGRCRVDVGCRPRGHCLGDIGTSRRAARRLTFGNVSRAGYPEHAAVAFSTGSGDLVVREVAASAKEDTQHT